MFLMVAALGLVWSVPSASAVIRGIPACKQVSKLVRVGQSFNGAVCRAVTYMTVNGKVITSRACTCHATICTWCCVPHRTTSVTNAYCTPLLLVRSP
jgi:hypothetical protein